ncbi:LysE family translocator [Ochrobactrum sp. XJ1]|nr:LysE family translocator [Ochrobactrum sp. XJ1]
MGNNLCEEILKIIAFSFPIVMSPGPNNILLASNSIKYGVWKSFPAMMGVSAGVTLLFLITSYGASEIITSNHRLYTAMRIFSCAYLLYLSYKIFVSSSHMTSEYQIGAPTKFLEAALLQILNPKIWLLGTSASAAFLPMTESAFWDSFIMAGALGIVFLPCNLAWMIAGSALKSKIENKKTEVIINRAMALLLAASVFFIFF